MDKILPEIVCCVALELFRKKTDLSAFRQTCKHFYNATNNELFKKTYLDRHALYKLFKSRNIKDVDMKTVKLVLLKSQSQTTSLTKRYRLAKGGKPVFFLFDNCELLSKQDMYSTSILIKLTPETITQFKENENKIRNWYKESVKSDTEYKSPIQNFYGSDGVYMSVKIDPYSHVFYKSELCSYEDYPEILEKLSSLKILGEVYLWENKNYGIGMRAINIIVQESTSKLEYCMDESVKKRKTGLVTMD